MLCVPATGVEHSLLRHAGRIRTFRPFAEGSDRRVRRVRPTTSMLGAGLPSVWLLSLPPDNNVAFDGAGLPSVWLLSLLPDNNVAFDRRFAECVVVVASTRQQRRFRPG